jgi:MoaA/NifB/PqqE/SkfB family radical SAM enzyme
MIVVWRITTRCNLACPFCAYDRSQPFTRVEADPAVIRAFCATLADYQQHTGDQVLISWLGGEPLLWPTLPALTVQANALGLRVSATTNGTTLRHPEIRQHILDHYAELTVSLDAPGPAHDDLRRWPGGFASLRENVTALARSRHGHPRRLKLRVNAVLLRSTIRHFAELAREVSCWGVDELTFNLLGGRDRPEFFPANRPLPDQLKSFITDLSALRQELRPSGLAIAGSAAYLDRLYASTSGVLRAPADCAPGERFLFINEDGLVSPCSFTENSLGIPVADLHTAQQLLDLPARYRSRLERNRPGVCADCPSTHVFEKFLPAVA